MPLVQCKLCLEFQSEVVNLFDTRCQGISLRIIIHKLFSLKLKSGDGSTFLCFECNRVLTECYSFYERVLKAQNELTNNKTDSELNVLQEDEIKDETPVLSLAHPEKEVQEPQFIKEEFDLGDDYYLKSEYQDIYEDYGDDNFDSVNYGENSDTCKKEEIEITKCDEFSTDYMKKKTKKKKKTLSKHKKDSSKVEPKEITSKTKKKPNKRVKKVSDDDVDNEEDPKVLINQNGAFIVKRNALEALINKFFNLECELCTEPTKFPSVRHLFEHYESQHKTKGYVKCCDTQFRIRKSINNHLARHLQPSAFECHICKKFVTRPEDLKYHIESHLPEAQRSLQCDQCEKRFAYPSHLRLHKYSHTPMDKRQIHQCKICNKIFTLPIFLSIHMSSKHTAKYLCPHCGKKYKEKNHFQNHLRAHNPNEEDKVECKECGKVLSHEDGLRRHMRRHAVTLTCPQCDYIAHRNAELNKHIRIRHTDIKPHVCVVCGKGFKLKRSCNVHMAQHTGERNYTCPFCGRTFVDPANCYSHQRKMHPVEFKNKAKLK